MSTMDRTRPRPPADRAAVIRSALVIGASTGLYAAAFGAVAVAAGASVAQSMVLSLLVFTGGSQFAATGVLDGGGSPAAALGAGWLLGVRNAFYGLRVAPLLRGWSLPRRLLAAHWTLDESAGMAIVQEDDATARLAFWATGASIFVLWNVGTVVGAVGASAIGDPEQYGLDAAAPAAFVAFLAPALRTPAARGICAASVAVCAAAVPLTRPGVPVLLAAVPALGYAAWATLGRRR
jgi:predicted branched-subunit amino acid permease